MQLNLHLNPASQNLSTQNLRGRHKKFIKIFALGVALSSEAQVTTARAAVCAALV
jgi:hypothetical protein